MNQHHDRQLPLLLLILLRFHRVTPSALERRDLTLCRCDRGPHFCATPLTEQAQRFTTEAAPQQTTTARDRYKMTDLDMRLRLVVRRHGLPEARLMWNVRLDRDPTISKLLEQLDKDVPLESEHWGLEDYVVELHDADGTDFECLHFQPVRSVLKPDDRVL